MASKTCGECRFYNEDYNFCLHWRYEDITAGSDVCNYFALPTNGDRIRQMSNEELAEFLTNPPCFVCSKGDAAGECTDTWRKKDCKSAILERLNAPAESEGEDE